MTMAVVLEEEEEEGKREREALLPSSFFLFLPPLVPPFGYCDAPFWSPGNSGAQRTFFPIPSCPTSSLFLRCTTLSPADWRCFLGCWRQLGNNCSTEARVVLCPQLMANADSLFLSNLSTTQFSFAITCIHSQSQRYFSTFNGPKCLFRR